MITRSFALTALAVTLGAGLAVAQQNPQTGATAATGTTGAHSSTAAQQPSTSMHQPATATSQPGTAAHAAHDKFTDAKQFVREELHENLVLTDIYEMAGNKADNQAVKEVAKTALQDHKQAADKLKELAKTHSIQIPEDNNAKSSDAHVQNVQNMKQRLQGLDEKQFDKTFLSEIIPMHEAEIARYQQAADQAQPQEVKQFAQQCIPKLQQHLTSSKQAWQQVTGSAWSAQHGRSYTPTAAYDTQSAQPQAGTSQNTNTLSSTGNNMTNPSTAAQPKPENTQE